VKLIVGLGNPGARYARTRHNVGWMAADAIADRWGFGPERAKWQGRIREGTLGGERVTVLEPDTFMNLSGDSVGAAARFLKLAPSDVIVLHDEIDLAPGKLRVKAGGGHAGHNGLRSIHQHLGPDYRRVRIGVGHPGDKAQVANWVLHDFAKADDDWLGPLLTAIADAAPRLATGDDAGFQNAVAQAVAPPPPPKPAKPAAPPAAGPPAAESPAAETPAERRLPSLDDLRARFAKE
jgi:PTH1 family peptidyl-tRNA hydrolase